MPAERRHPEFMLDTALGMYDLTHVEVFWERQHDTHALLAWGPARLVVVFRGTASFANVLADLQVSACPQLPTAGCTVASRAASVTLGTSTQAWAMLWSCSSIWLCHL